MTKAEFAAMALAQPSVEFVGSLVFHLSGVSCGISTMTPYTLKDGSLCTSYVGGTPFPAYVATPSSGRRLCRHCRKISQGQRRGCGAKERSG